MAGISLSWSGSGLISQLTLTAPSGTDRGSRADLAVPFERFAHCLGIGAEPWVEKSRQRGFLPLSRTLLFGQLRWLPALLGPPVPFADCHPSRRVHLREFVKVA